MIRFDDSFSTLKQKNSMICNSILGLEIVEAQSIEHILRCFLTSNYSRLKWTGQSSNDLAGGALGIGIVVHTCGDVKREVEVRR